MASGLEVLNAANIQFLRNPPMAILKITTVSAANTNQANSAFVPINFDTTVSDTYVGHSNTVNNSRYTAQMAGWYWVKATSAWQVPNATGNRGTQLAVNGVGVPYLANLLPANAVANFGGFEVSGPVYLNVGDYVEAWGFQSSGGPLSLQNTTCNMSLFRMHD